MVQALIQAYPPAAYKLTSGGKSKLRADMEGCWLASGWANNTMPPDLRAKMLEGCLKQCCCALPSADSGSNDADLNLKPRHLNFRLCDDDHVVTVSSQSSLTGSTGSLFRV
eukprot:2964944-Rhodomonas_salina.2